MANQLVSLAGFQPPTCKTSMQEASYGERGSNFSPSKPLISHDQWMENHKSIRDDSRERISKCAEGEKPMEVKLQRRGDEKLVLRRLGIGFLTSWVSYVLKKAKALYYRLCCDTFKHPRMEFEASLVDAYFSVPVVSATTTVPYAV